MEEERYIIFNSTGIPEKELVATVVISHLKRTYPKDRIIVISQHPEIWLHNPTVYRVYKGGLTPYFHEDFVKGKDSIIFWQDPYNTDDWIHRRKSLLEVWMQLCGLNIEKIGSKNVDAKLYFTFREYEATKRMMEQNIQLNLRQTLCAAEIRKSSQRASLNI